MSNTEIAMTPWKDFDWSGAQIIGTGEYATVYLVSNKQTKQKVAIKVQKKKPIVGKINPIASERAALSALSDHPHVITLHSTWSDHQHDYLVMKYAKGGEVLNYIMTNGPLEEKTLKVVFYQLVSAISHAHENGYVHRDLKLDNLLFLDPPDKKRVESFHVAIADWGFSTTWSVFKTLNVHCGSIHYASPEITKGKQYTGPEVDVWSLGVILWALATGQFPFDGNSLREIGDLIVSADHPDNIQSPREKLKNWPWFSSELCDLMLSIFRTDSSKRPQIQQIQEHPWLKPLILSNKMNTRTKAKNSSSSLGVIAPHYIPNQSNAGSSKDHNQFSSSYADFILSRSTSTSSISYTSTLGSSCSSISMYTSDDYSDSDSQSVSSFLDHDIVDMTFQGSDFSSKQKRHGSIRDFNGMNVVSPNQIGSSNQHKKTPKFFNNNTTLYFSDSTEQLVDFLGKETNHNNVNSHRTARQTNLSNNSLGSNYSVTVENIGISSNNSSAASLSHQVISPRNMPNDPKSLNLTAVSNKKKPKTKHKKKQTTTSSTKSQNNNNNGHNNKRYQQRAIEQQQQHYQKKQDLKKKDSQVLSSSSKTKKKGGSIIRAGSFIKRKKKQNNSGSSSDNSSSNTSHINNNNNNNNNNNANNIATPKRKGSKVSRLFRVHALQRLSQTPETKKKKKKQKNKKKK